LGLLEDTLAINIGGVYYGQGARVPGFAELEVGVRYFLDVDGGVSAAPNPIGATTIFVGRVDANGFLVFNPRF
jgi:hypothetical protein